MINETTTPDIPVEVQNSKEAIWVELQHNLAGIIAADYISAETEKAAREKRYLAIDEVQAYEIGLVQADTRIQDFRANRLDPASEESIQCEEMYQRLQKKYAKPKKSSSLFRMFKVD